MLRGPDWKDFVSDNATLFDDHFFYGIKLSKVRLLSVVLSRISGNFGSDAFSQYKVFLGFLLHFQPHFIEFVGIQLRDLKRILGRNDIAYFCGQQGALVFGCALEVVVSEVLIKHVGLLEVLPEKRQAGLDKACRLAHLDLNFEARLFILDHLLGPLGVSNAPIGKVLEVLLTNLILTKVHFLNRTLGYFVKVLVGRLPLVLAFQPFGEVVLILERI